MSETSLGPITFIQHVQYRSFGNCSLIYTWFNTGNSSGCVSLGQSFSHCNFCHLFCLPLTTSSAPPVSKIQGVLHLQQISRSHPHFLINAFVLQAERKIKTMVVLNIISKLPFCSQVHIHMVTHIELIITHHAPS